MGVGDPARDRIIGGPANHDLAVGDHRDRLSIGVECRFRDLSRDVLIPRGVERVLGRGHEHRPRHRIRIVEIHRVERVPAVKDEPPAVRRDVEPGDVDVLEVGERGGRAVDQRSLVDVVGAIGAIREEENVVIARPAGLPVIAVRVGDGEERPGLRVMEPDIAAIVTAIVSTFPLGTPPLEGGPTAVGTAHVQSTERIVEPPWFATFDGDLVRTRRSIHIPFEVSGESHHDVAVRVTPHAAEGDRSIEIRQATDLRPIRSHRPEVRGSIPVAFEDDRGTVGRPRRIMIPAWMTGESRRGTTLERHAPEIASPTEDDGLSVRADARESGKVDVALSTTGRGRRFVGTQPEEGQKQDKGTEPVHSTGTFEQGPADGSRKHVFNAPECGLGRDGTS